MSFADIDLKKFNDKLKNYVSLYSISLVIEYTCEFSIIFNFNPFLGVLGKKYPEKSLEQLAARRIENEAINFQPDANWCVAINNE